MLLIVGTLLAMYALLLAAPAVVRWACRRHWAAKRAACKRAARQRWLGRKVVVAVALLVVAGCKGPLPDPPLLQTGTDIARVIAYLDVAEAEADSRSADLLQRARKAAAAAAEANRRDAGEYGRVKDLLTVANTQLAAYHDQWIGDKTWRTLGWIVGIWAGLGFASALLGGFGAGGVLGSVARLVLNGMPLANPFAWLARRINSGTR